MGIIETMCFWWPNVWWVFV